MRPSTEPSLKESLYCGKPISSSQPGKHKKDEDCFNNFDEARVFYSKCVKTTLCDYMVDLQLNYINLLQSKVSL